MSAKIKCNEISTGKAKNDMLTFSLHSMTSREEIVNIIEDGLKAILTIRGRRNLERTGSIIASILDKANIPTSIRTKIDPEDLIGLIGEILCEVFHIENGCGEQFYTKWKETGTSKSRGIDMILKKDNHLFVIDSKHCHKTLMGHSNFDTVIAGIFDEAFRYNEISHLMMNLARLAIRLSKTIRTLNATNETVNAVEVKSKMIQDCLLHSLYDINVTVITDKKILDNTNLLNMINKLKIDESYISPRLSGNTIAVDSLEDTSLQMSLKYG